MRGREDHTQHLEYHDNGICNSITTVSKDALVMLVVKQAVAKGYTEIVEGGLANLAFASSKTRRGRVVDNGRISPTITCVREVYKVENEHRIRKLTPKECFRLMGFNDDEFERAKAVNSDTQLYKQAGNSIVVDVLVALMGGLDL